MLPPLDRKASDVQALLTDSTFGLPEAQTTYETAQYKPRLKLDAIIAPTGSPAWPTDLLNGDHFLGASSSPAAVAGYPSITVPAGWAGELPVGVLFMGRGWSESRLISLAFAYEQASRQRKPPKFLPTIPLN